MMTGPQCWHVTGRVLELLKNLHDLKATGKLFHERHSWREAKVILSWNISLIFAIFIGVMRLAL